MEELHRLHKDVPFGWVAWLQELFAERARRAAVRDTRVPITRIGQHPGDLHHVAGPH
ncbi:hypothetical protein [Phenylobacterium sp.]|uniref:hypothetical protein n=1 Tax=Phenylobacterium sp. TaxID=1871053 RepID=UPI00273027A3|nr:hypothetical protein [Phenylobacterium sp.]MDP1599394.1 hypothetical protein [Phenylobacterium sp.]MDP3591116.1 hypothetical protein [Phenylobacterium sp.]